MRSQCRGPGSRDEVLREDAAETRQIPTSSSPTSLVRSRSILVIDAIVVFVARYARSTGRHKRGSSRRLIDRSFQALSSFVKSRKPADGISLPTIACIYANHAITPDSLIARTPFNFPPAFPPGHSFRNSPGRSYRAPPRRSGTFEASDCRTHTRVSPFLFPHPAPSPPSSALVHPLDRHRPLLSTHPVPA